MKTLLLALLLVGCAQVKKPQLSDNLVLIQGMHLDGNAWTQVKYHLQSQELNVMDLGRIGRDEIKEASLKNIAQKSCESIPDKSILVGHNFGGAIANAMVGICPDKVTKIIYISALVPSNGEKPFDLMNKTDRTNYSKVVTAGKFKIIPKEAKTFFKTSDPSIREKTELPSLSSEWVSLYKEAVFYDEAKFSAIPKSYIYTEKDPIISLTTQFQYTSRNGIKNVDGIPTGHYPMTSSPKGLARLIAKWAKDPMI